MTNPEPTTETKYGPARFHVSADGCLSLNWQDVTVNRVEYSRAHAYEVREKYAPARKRREVYAHRKDHKQPSTAAVLVTPEACARARAEEARVRLVQAERDAQEAREKEARARDEFAQAVAALAQFQQENPAA